jgi:hypothetical protein
MNKPELYTHLALARLLKLSVTTIKSYRRKFPGCILVASQGKPIQFDEKAKAVCLRIRDLFATGMSVPEVRARLAEEFDWISPDDPQPKEAAPPRIELPPLYTSAMSNMAQSLVGIAQKQGAVLTRLEELGDTLASERSVTEAAPGSSLDTSTSSATSSATFSATFSGTGADQRPSQRPSQGLSQGLSPSSQSPLWPSRRPLWLDEFSSLVERLETCLTRLDTQAVLLSTQTVSQAAVQPSSPAAPVRLSAPPRQPDRSFMSLPLVAAGEDGILRGIAGSSWGRITCSDIKVLAACPAAPERACTLEWIEMGANWHLFLRKHTQQAPLAVAYLREVSDNLGNTAVLVQQVWINQEKSNPTDFFFFLRNLQQTAE